MSLSNEEHMGTWSWRKKRRMSTTRRKKRMTSKGNALVCDDASRFRLQRTRKACGDDHVGIEEGKDGMVWGLRKAGIVSSMDQLCRGRAV